MFSLRCKKSFITNFLALCIILIGYQLPEYSELVTTIGYFALSGSITNWLAIHMLFEKVPFLYGSGVIPNKFKEFKLSIRNIILEQFFTAENMQKALLDDKLFQGVDLSVLPECVDYNKLFDSLVAGILESPLGAMLNMMGGVKALQGLREPIIKKLQETLYELSQDQVIKDKINSHMMSNDLNEKLISKVETIVDTRLEELTPQKVKEIVEDIIYEHLGWLVVWGGVFGGLLGLIKAVAS